MKKLTAFFLSLCLILSLAACGAGSPETTAAPETTASPETTAIPETTAAPETTASPETTAAPETPAPSSENAGTSASAPAGTQSPAEPSSEPAESGSFSLWGEGNAAGIPGNAAAIDPAQLASPDPAQISSPLQLTIEDIQAMNGDSTVIDLYNNNGYLSTLVGKYYDKPVTNAEEGVESIRGLATLLGLTKGCEFFVVYGEKDNDGYTYYTYQQRYGGYTLQYSTLRIIIDPEGYTAGLTCSFVPNAGMAEEAEAISAREAEQVVKDTFPKLDLTYYSEHSVRLAATFDNVVYNCWVVYTNNPDADESFDMPYVGHYITTEGKYLAPIPANDFASSNQDAINVEGYFEGLTTQNYSTSITLSDGSRRSIQIPLAKNSKDGRYYLMDPSRKMAVAQYGDFVYRGLINFVSSDSPEGFREYDLSAYSNYIKAYDFYKERGIESVDGFGIPILITVGYCDQSGNAVNNSCFYGIHSGWACFAVSDANRQGDALDVVTHEFTHGVTSQSMQGIFYRNEPGSINESYSDIMGNICEKTLGETRDTGWLIGENADKISRDMADPNKYQQPAFVGDEYYVPTVLAPSMSINDYGGVHINNSLVGHIAYLLDEAGMSLEEQFSMWSTSIELLTPYSDYEDLHGILLFSLKINGWLGKYGRAVNKAFADAGLNENWNESYLEAAKEGCGRVSFQTDGYLAGSEVLVLFATADGTVVSNTFPDPSGMVSALLPAGSYIAQLVLIENNDPIYYNYTGTAWREGGQFGLISVKDGGAQSLSALNSGKAVAGGDAPAPTSPAPSVPSPTEPDSGAWRFVSYNGGYFSLTIPEGWRVEMLGVYGDYALKVYDPQRPSRQFFYYAALSPFHKSEAARRALIPYDYTGLIGAGPVLETHNLEGVLDIWDECIAYQKKCSGRQFFTSLYDLDVIGVSAYQGPYKGQAIETAALAACDAENGDSCGLGIAGALFDLDIYRYAAGNWYYTLFDTFGILLPEEEYAEHAAELAQCFLSLEFTQDYINASQGADIPLAENALRRANMTQIAGAVLEIFDSLMRD